MSIFTSLTEADFDGIKTCRLHLPIEKRNTESEDYLVRNTFPLAFKSIVTRPPISKQVDEQPTIETHREQYIFIGDDERSLAILQSCGLDAYLNRKYEIPSSADDWNKLQSTKRYFPDNTPREAFLIDVYAFELDNLSPSEQEGFKHHLRTYGSEIYSAMHDELQNTTDKGTADRLKDSLKSMFRKKGVDDYVTLTGPLGYLAAGEWDRDEPTEFEVKITVPLMWDDEADTELEARRMLVEQ